MVKNIHLKVSENNLYVIVFYFSKYFYPTAAVSFKFNVDVSVTFVTLKYRSRSIVASECDYSLVNSQIAFKIYREIPCIKILGHLIVDLSVTLITL